MGIGFWLGSTHIRGVGMKRLSGILVSVPILLALFALAVVPPVIAAQITDVSYSGTCRNFVFNVSAANLSGCWDVKLDLPADVRDPVSGDWKSAFYYLDGLFCGPENSAVLDVRMDTGNETLVGTVKLRQNQTVVERGFVLSQDCPQPISDTYVILAACIVVLVFAYTLAWWWKRQ